MIRLLVTALLSLVLFGCSSGGSSDGVGTLGSVIAGPNVVAIAMGCGYINEPCVSVTICTPGTAACQTIPNVLLDTGSYGLRLFKQAISVGLTQLTNGSGQSIAECTTYGDGSSQWGPVMLADVKLANDSASGVPIQVVDSTFSTAPTNCTDLDTSPSNDGYNGILGVGQWVQDCGSNCTTMANNNVYYACASGSCSGTTLGLASQVTNPVALLGTYNNGVAVALPFVPGDGYSGNVIGSLILGIGQLSNNTPTNATVFGANANAEFSTSYGGRTLTGIIDSGSNGMYFQSSTIAACSGASSKFYCPSGDVTSSAVQTSSSGGTSQTVPFVIGNAISITSGSNYRASGTLGGYLYGYFDWGLPFFLGRTVYVGFKGRSSTLGTGPFWAY